LHNGYALNGSSIGAFLKVPAHKISVEHMFL